MQEVTAQPKLPTRAADSHKGTYGHVFVCAGSVGMTGAAALAGESALRAGAGLVTLGCPASVLPILASRLTCCMTRPLREIAPGALALGALDEILRFASGCDVVLFGPGIGRAVATQKLVLATVAQTPKPMVVDADALFALGADLDPLKAREQSTILTPHPGEMARLRGISGSEVQADRRKMAANFAGEHGAVLVLKGHRTVVSDGSRIYVNETGNPGLATAGSGDVLAGIIAGLLAQGIPAFESAQLGVYLHGLAGDIARDRLCEESLIAADLLETLAEAFGQVRSS